MTELMYEIESETARLSNIWVRMARNITNDFLEFYIVTSQAGGLEESEMRPFGAGKSTFAIWMAYRCWAYAKGYLKFYREEPEGKILLIDKTPEDVRLEIFKTIVEKYVKWHIDDVLQTVKESDTVLPAIVWDDVQLSAPAYQHISPQLKEKLEKLTILRPKLSNLIMTAPSISDIARPLRRNITAEIIIPQRGIYEVQFITKVRDFRNPVNDTSSLRYDATGTFDMLPKPIDELYKKLRAKSI